MSTPTPPPGVTGLAADLHRYLQQGRDSMVRALDGLSEYDVRRPMTPTGTNLLGIKAVVTDVQNGTGARQAVSADMKCEKATVFGPCHLKGPFTAGSTISVDVDTGRDILPDHDGMKFVVSVPKK